tara:strand:+ start:121 stop:948 length:828 start_codon:yes stop_codon:yes gene_type:complete
MKFFSVYKFTFIISLTLHAAILWTYYPNIIGSKSLEGSNDTILISLVTSITTASASNSSSEIQQEKTPPITEEFGRENTKNPQIIQSQLSNPPPLLGTIIMRSTKTSTISTNAYIKDKKATPEVKKIKKAKPLKVRPKILKKPKKQLKPKKHKANVQLASKAVVQNSSKGETSTNSNSTDTLQAESFEPARFINLRQPDYPYSERLRRHEGSVDFEVHISKQGKILDIHTKRSSGSNLLDRISKQAVLKSQVQPARKNGGPVASIKTLRFTYKLD